MKRKLLVLISLLMALTVCVGCSGGGSGGGSSKRYTVAFESNGGTVVESQTVKKNQHATEPEAPTREGYEFVCWCSDEELEDEFDFSTRITSDIVLYARWDEIIDNLDDEIIDLGDVQNMIDEGEAEAIFGEKGEVRTLIGEFTDKKIEDTDDALEVIETAQPLFGGDFDVGDGEISKQSTSGNSSAPKESFYVYTPEIEGIEVIGSDIIIATDKDGKATGLFNTYDKDLPYVDTYFEISAEDAEIIAINNLLEKNDITSNKEIITNLIVCDTDPVILTNVENTTIPQLCYRVILSYDFDKADESVETVTLPELNETYYIGAAWYNEREIVKVVSNVMSWTGTSITAQDINGKSLTLKVEKEGSKFRLKDSERNIYLYTKTSEWDRENNKPKVVTTIEEFENTPAPRKAALLGNFEKAYDFYSNKFGRKSYDGKSGLVAIYDSADSGAKYGFDNETKETSFLFDYEGILGSCLDIVGHEYTHAVSSQIVSKGKHKGESWGTNRESEALSEAYSDIMGSFIEGKDGDNRWYFGEDKGRVKNGSDRSMKDPYSCNFGNYTWKKHYSELANSDEPHLNSTIFSHAAYLMMTDLRTSEISKDIWASVFYSSLYRLTSGSSFLDARGAVIAAAESHGFTSHQQSAIKDAFDKVGICEHDNVRIVLTWGYTPSDIDSHLVGPRIDGGEFHTWYSEKQYVDDDDRWIADLDYDDVTSYGPEITTIHRLTPGEYYFYVHDYTNRYSTGSTQLAKSGATVKIYASIGGKVTENTFSTNNSSSGKYWNVCKITIDNSGKVTVTSIDTYAEYENYTSSIETNRSIMNHSTKSKLRARASATNKENYYEIKSRQAS